MLGVEDHPLALADEECDGVGDHLRFSSRVTRTTFSTCNMELLPTSVQTGAKRVGEDPQTRIPIGARVATVGHSERHDLGVLQPLCLQELEELELLGI